MISNPLQEHDQLFYDVKGMQQRKPSVLRETKLKGDKGFESCRRHTSICYNYKNRYFGFINWVDNVNWPP